MRLRITQVLEQTLLEDNKAVQAQVTSAVDGDGNGCKLLWNIAKMSIPIFDVTNPVAIPKWPGGIHCFAKLCVLHCELARHRGLLLSHHQIC